MFVITVRDITLVITVRDRNFYIIYIINLRYIIIIFKEMKKNDEYFKLDNKLDKYYFCMTISLFLHFFTFYFL